jgi:hypothetical protein
VFVVVAGLLGLTACSGEKPSGLATFKPSASGGSSPSPTSTSKWTPEQQQVIDGYDGFTRVYESIYTGAEKIDMARVHAVAKEPFATVTMKDVDATLSTGYVQAGKVVNTISSVTVNGDKATIKTCYDQTHTKFVNPGKASAPAAQIPPPTMATVSLMRERGVWLLTGFKGDEGACTHPLV